MEQREQFAELLNRHFSPHRKLSCREVDSLFSHYQLLCRWNRVVNLTSIGGLEDAVVRHYCESLFLAELAPEGVESVADIGSGGGFPGIPLAVALPETAVTLVESHQRKAVFLREASRSLPNVKLSAVRGEALNATVDWVVSRAVKGVEVLKVARRIGRGVGLLMGAADTEELMRAPGVVWSEPVKLPWGARRVALVGRIVQA